VIEGIWVALAFAAGMAAAITCFKASRVGCAAILFALPCGLIVLLARPDGLLYEPFPAFFAWAVFAFTGFCAGAAAVAMRIVR
jgi:hypothetical protein